MANRRPAPNRASITRSRLASFLLVLLPGFMFLGFLAPAAVKVQYTGEEEAELDVAFRNFQVPVRRPLVGPEPVAATTGGSELEAIRNAVVSGARLVADGARDVFDMVRFDTQGGDRIILDEQAAEQEVVSRLFDSTVESDTILAVDLTPLWTRSRFDVIPGPLRTWGERPDDDFAGELVTFTQPVPQPVEVPEPQSAALLTLGLVGLSVVSRRMGPFGLR